MSRREFVRTSALFSAGATLAACAQPTPAPAPPTEVPAPEQAAEAPAQPTAAPAEPTAAPAPKAEDVTISMWTHDILYVQFFTSRGDVWKQNQEGKNITFDFQQIPYGEVFTKVLTQLAAGSGAPDLVGIEQGAFPSFMRKEIADTGLVDLTPLVGAEKDKFYRWEPYTFQGKLYGVESALCPCVMYYRPDLFEAAGVPYNQDWTWDEYYAAGKTLLDKGMYLSIVDETSGGTNWAIPSVQRQGLLYFTEHGELVIDTPESIEALTYAVNATNDQEVLMRTGADTYWGPGTVTAFLEDKVATVMGADWYLGFFMKANLADQAGKWRVALLPKFPSGGFKGSSAGGTGFAITKHSANPELVYSLLHFTYMTKESQILRFKEINYFPHMIEAIESDEIRNYQDDFLGGQAAGAVYAQSAKEAGALWQHPLRNEATSELANNIALAFEGKLTPEAALKAAADFGRKVLEEGA
jgi:ABC-type glycerol-3-phosphate transport system substrate-binding protein